MQGLEELIPRAELVSTCTALPRGLEDVEADLARLEVHVGVEDLGHEGRLGGRQL